MSELFYTSEQNHLLLIALLKEYGIKKVVVSPGATNITFVGSIQHDTFFEMYSCIDERSAAYMACGLSEESGEPVIISCTGATSARNYMPALTEAYYRKLPIVAITSTQDISRVGHLNAQVTDRSNPPLDVTVKSVHLQTVKDGTDKWDCYIKINKALQALTKHGGGPVHINLTTTYSFDYSIKHLPSIKKINYYTQSDRFPDMPQGRIAVFVGAHHRWSDNDMHIIDTFCAQYDAVVLCDHTSNFKGKYRVLSSLAGLQKSRHIDLLDIDLLIHIGEMSGGYEAFSFKAKEVWRVNEDGEIRDQFKRLTSVFEMSETDFFKRYASAVEIPKCEQRKSWEILNKELHSAIPELPFSNIWMAQYASMLLPDKSVVYFGILNSLRSWNFFEIPSSVSSYSNTGGFGIDGIMSTMIGSSLSSPNRIHYAILGDLAFFYDMNILGNRHVGNNVRILLVNNGKGMEFRLINHNGYIFGEETDKYMAAGGHNGNRSRSFVKNLAESLGYQYFSASDKEQFITVCKSFFKSEAADKPMIFEAFTDTESETSALKLLEDLVTDAMCVLKNKTKELAKSTLGASTQKTIKRLLGK
ncbi:MAG: 2-succinyl-5-enolpyruvyl-6-hydroxy-3-cyclohexene-1-carboxylate synthase [Prevotella sp.]|nr:2-succinyl-5-enolpyruvyl-6-hydroxy-3-cyclohexene-1-carboxylate synthase [Prevotella sp.]